MKPAWPMENWPVRPFTKFSDTARITAMPMWLMFWKVYSSPYAGFSSNCCSMKIRNGMATKNGIQQRVHARVLRGVEDARDCREDRAEHEGEADHQVDVHAHQRGDGRVPRHRAHGCAHPRVEDDPLQHEHQDDAGEDGDQIDVADR